MSSKGNRKGEKGREGAQDQTIRERKGWRPVLPPGRRMRAGALHLSSPIGLQGCVSFQSLFVYLKDDSQLSLDSIVTPKRASVFGVFACLQRLVLRMLS